MVLDNNVRYPVAVLPKPLELLESAVNPMAVF